MVPGPTIFGAIPFIWYHTSTIYGTGTIYGTPWERFWTGTIYGTSTKVKKSQKVSKVNCIHCDKCYIGQTRRTVKRRLKDHKDAIRLQNNSNAIAVHTSISGHSIDPFDAEIIGKDNRYELLLAKESLLIDSANTMNLTTCHSNKSLVQLIQS